jgi:spore germination cell wall hydrolase CwlJ-like protein
MAESQGQPYEAQVAVGEVVINRTKSGKFPATISGVIYQVINGYYQFTPVVNGWIDKPANETAIRAAKEAMGGTNLTDGALFYYDNTTTNPWILSKPVSATYGAMIFAY